MPDEDKNFGGSLVLDFRKWRRDVKPIYNGSQNIWIYKPRSPSTSSVSASFLMASIVLFYPTIGINSKSDVSASLVARI